MKTKILQSLFWTLGLSASAASFARSEAAFPPWQISEVPVCMSWGTQQNCTDRLVCEVVCGVGSGVVGGAAGGAAGALCPRVCHRLPECREIPVCVRYSTEAA
jgi:hypothetical protein